MRVVCARAVPEGTGSHEPPVVNPALRTITGRVPPLAIVVHRGRKSGREYRTPVMAFRFADGFVIALTYGAHVDWLHNVLAAGGCTLERRGRPIGLTQPRVAGRARAWTDMPSAVRPILHLLGVSEFVCLAPE